MMVGREEQLEDTFFLLYRTSDFSYLALGLLSLFHRTYFIL